MRGLCGVGIVCWLQRVLVGKTELNCGVSRDQSSVAASFVEFGMELVKHLITIVYYSDYHPLLAINVKI